jgi:DNA-binding transcriptional LysR family regulator
VSAHYLPGVVQRYAALHPENRIRILDHAAPDVEAAVLRREAEFGVTMESTRHRELRSVAFHKDRFVAVCRDDHALAKKRRVSWKQLEPHTMIFAGHEVGARSLVDDAVARKDLRWRHFYEVQRSSTAIGMVARGVGITIVSDLALQPGAYPRLRAIPLVDPVVSRTLVLITRTNAQLSPAAQALYDLIRSA